MKRMLTILVLGIMSIVLLTAQGCGGAKEFSIVDQREVLGEVTTEKTEPVDNTQGTTDLSQDIAARRQFRYQIDMQLNESSGLNRKDVEDRILETYDLVAQNGEQLCLIPADVPAQHSYLYNLEWTKVLREGNIEEGSTPGQGEILGTYKIVVDLQCQVTGVEVLQ
jgi:hypothetical protein